MLKKSRSKGAYKYIILIVIMVLATGCKGETLGDEKQIVAKVNGEAITKDELYDVLVEQYGAQALDSLISEKIINREATKAKIEVNEEDIESELNKISAYYGGNEGLVAAMANYGYTLEDIKKDIVVNIQIKKLLEPNIVIGEEEIADYFEQNKFSFVQEEAVWARHILVEDEAQANELKKKIEAGEDFIELAKEYTTDEASKATGGDLGFFGRGEMIDEFEEAAFSLEVGKVSEPIETDFGYHIIKVEEKREAKEANLADSKEEIKEILLEAKMPEEYQKWYQAKYDEYKIENYLIKE